VGRIVETTVAMWTGIPTIPFIGEATIVGSPLFAVPVVERFTWRELLIAVCGYPFCC